MFTTNTFEGLYEAYMKLEHQISEALSCDRLPSEI